MWVALFLFSTIFLGIAADEIILTSSEKKNPDEMDMTFGKADPAHIEEIKRLPADVKKKRAEHEPKVEEAIKPEQSALGSLTPLEETPKQEVKPVPEKKSEEPPEPKKVEKRRQHRGRAKPSLTDSDKEGIEIA